MILESRSYGGKLFRPTPVVFNDESSGVSLVATPWGTRESARRTVEMISELFTTLERDQEATTPYQRLPSLSPVGNNLRTGILMANEFVYGTFNKDEYRTGLEIFAGVRRGNEFTWSVVGMPHTILLRKGKPCFPLALTTDLAFDMSKEGELPPLPGRFLGVDKSIDAQIMSLRTEPGDRLLLLSRSYLPPVLLTRKSDDMNIEETIRVCAQDHASMPAWVGLLSF